MKCIAIALLAIVFCGSAFSQTPASSNQVAGGATAPAAIIPDSDAKLGIDDVIGISVYDAPQLTRNVRINADGVIRLPMVRQHIKAAGLTPEQLENSIAAVLVNENVMVDPIVTVTVVEYHSRPITVIGAVKNPLTFQVSGTTTLLEAIVKAGGLSENAGSEIEVSHPASLTGGASVSLTERIPVSSLMDISNPVSNMTLSGGEKIRVLEAGKVLVVGNVKHPGPLQITDGSETSVLKAVTLSGGLDSFTSRKAYIYRVEAGGHSNRIPVEIKRIMSLKSPDVPLQGNDILYVPNATGQRLSAKALSITFGVGLAIAGIVIYLTR